MFHNQENLRIYFSLAKNIKKKPLLKKKEIPGWKNNCIKINSGVGKIKFEKIPGYRKCNNSGVIKVKIPGVGKN